MKCGDLKDKNIVIGGVVFSRSGTGWCGSTGGSLSAWIEGFPMAQVFTDVKGRQCKNFFIFLERGNGEYAGSQRAPDNAHLEAIASKINSGEYYSSPHRTNAVTKYL